LCPAEAILGKSHRHLPDELFSFDATGQVVEYARDHRNRLVKVVKKDAQGAVVETVELEYDVFDRKRPF